MSHFSFLRREDGLLEILQSDARRFEPLLEFFRRLADARSELDGADRELIYAYVAGLSKCEFCYGYHAAVGRALGVDPALLAALLAQEEPAAAGARFRPLLSLARKLILAPDELEPGDFRSVTEAGWSERTAQEVIILASAMKMANLLVAGHGVKGSEAYFESAARQAGGE